VPAMSSTGQRKRRGCVWGMGTHLRAGTRAAAAASAQGVCEGHVTMVGVSGRGMGEEHVGREGKKDPCIPGNRCPSHLRSETGARQGVLQRLGMYL
jgi:hypothetical protein